LWKNNITEVPDVLKELPNLKVIELETDQHKINQQFVISVINNDVSRAEKLLLLGADINYKWLNYGNLPFTTALFESHTIEMVKFLLDHNADVNLPREIVKSSSIKVWESEKQTGNFETFLTKKHSVEVTKYLKTINLIK
jgi:ankyrin repeat protein